MGLSNGAVCGVWAEGTEKTRRSYSMKVEGPMLYDRSTPIAYRRNDGVAVMDVQRFSVTTTQHQNIARSAAMGAMLTTFPLPGNLVNLAFPYKFGAPRRGGTGEFLTDLDPIAHTEDRFESYEGVDKDGNKVIRQRHITGGSAFDLWERHFICGEDENRFFLSELSARPESYADGLLLLMPEAVVEVTEGDVHFETVVEQGPEFVRKGRPFGSHHYHWHDEGDTTSYRLSKSRNEYANGVLRQGEWFFIPEGASKSLDRAAQAMAPLEEKSSHLATRVVHDGAKVYAKGIVRHQRNEHRRLHLDIGTWYRVYKNLSLASWSVSTRGAGGMD